MDAGANRGKGVDRNGIKNKDIAAERSAPVRADTRASPPKRSKRRGKNAIDRLLRACDDGSVLQLAADYIMQDREGTALPNIAGFCRSLGVGVSEFEGLRSSHPEIHSALCAVFEDEALNSRVSPSVLALYLRGRLDYGDRRGSEEEKKEVDAPLTVVFEHDVLDDGS